MSPLSAIWTNKPSKNDTGSLESYVKSMRRAIELLVGLGIMKSPQKDLEGSVEEVIKEIEKNEVLLYGRELDKYNLKKELKENYAELSELELEQREIENKIALLETKEKFRAGD